MSEVYEGDVCYVGHDHEGPDGRTLESGWHYSVVDGIPRDRLVLEDDGSYRLAEEDDESHFDKHHVQFVQAEFNDGEGSTSISPEQLAQIQQILGQE